MSRIRSQALLAAIAGLTPSVEGMLVRLPKTKKPRKPRKRPEAKRPMPCREEDHPSPETDGGEM